MGGRGRVLPLALARVATLEAPRLLGTLDPSAHDALRDRARPALRNVAGTVVGEVRPASSFA